MLSATPVNNRQFNDLRNQLAPRRLTEESQGSPPREAEKSPPVLRRSSGSAQTAFNAMVSKLPTGRADETSSAMTEDAGFGRLPCGLLDSVTVARSRKHIETACDTADEYREVSRALQASSFSLPAGQHAPTSWISIGGLSGQLSLLRGGSLCATQLHPSEPGCAVRVSCTMPKSGGGEGRLKQVDQGAQPAATLMTPNLLKRLESWQVEALSSHIGVA